MPSKLIITLDGNHFEVQTESDIVFNDGLLQLLSLWLMTVDDPGASAQAVIDELVARLSTNNNNLRHVVEMYLPTVS